MKKKTLNIIWAASLGFVVTNTSALNLVSNGSFENPVLASGGYQYLTNGNTYSGWTVIDERGGERPYIAHEARWKNIDAGGSQALVLNTESGIFTSIAVTAGETYEFSIRGFGGIGLDPLQIQIGDGTTPVGLNFGSSFQELSFLFTAPVTDSSTLLRIYNPTVSTDWRQWIIDDVEVTWQGQAGRSQNVPEAGTTLVLLGLSIFGLGAMKRRH